ncbi:MULTISPECIES: hypothetical protein [Staphylococcus]|nr:MULTISPECIES: hypothetical protein [Staphylococcus]GEP76478.1 hypothetical protein SCA04_07920 [Staphylococcus carnosus]GEP78701.1 hypothetical protein SCA05_04940 [Staphylococcus carnosus]
MNLPTNKFMNNTARAIMDEVRRNTNEGGTAANVVLHKTKS